MVGRLTTANFCLSKIYLCINYMKINKNNNELGSDCRIQMEQLMSKPFQTGGVTVDFSQNRVWLGAEELTLQPKVLELLVILCAARGQTISKSELIDRLWPNTVVGPDSLANTVTRLRKVLNDDAKSPKYIKTVQRKGYVWLPAVKSGAGEDALWLGNYKFWLMGGVALLIVSLIVFWLPQQQAANTEKFPFPDLSIKKLDEGGYEIEVGIDGELTKEKEAAMLKELKRITGEEGSDMVFTVDDVKPKCDKSKADEEQKSRCQQNSVNSLDN